MFVINDMWGSPEKLQELKLSLRKLEIAMHIELAGKSLKLVMLAIALLVFSQGSHAQVPFGSGQFQAPIGGGTFQQIPPAPAPQRPLPEIKIEQGGAPAISAADQVKVRVNSLRVTGQTVYPEDQLLALTGFKPGSDLSLVDLRQMATIISGYYHAKGYFVAQAYLPPQDIKNGTVTIAVLEGRYGKITLNNQAKISDSLVNGLLAGLNSGDIIMIAPLEERLLLLADVPGVLVSSNLTPGAAVGTSDLTVELTPARSVRGSVEADNAGNRYTGANRIGGTVNLINPTGHGDVLSLRVLTSGEGLKYARASYQAQVGRATVGAAYSWLDYRLGKEFSSLQAHGTAEIASVFASYPLIRSRNNNLYAMIDFDAKTFQDKIDSTSPPSVVDKKANVLYASLYGDHRDGFGGGGFSTYSLTLGLGDIDIRTPFALAADQAGPRSNGNFGKLGFFASRLQNLSGPFSLYGSIRGQFASKNLDISEKMGLGGMYAVRAYPEGEAYADEGYVATLEARMLLPKVWQAMPGRMHLIGFVDTGSVTLHKNPWVAGQNHRTLSGAGIGLTWEDYNNFAVRAYWAHKLGDAMATSAPDKSGRFWIQGIKYF